MRLSSFGVLGLPVLRAPEVIEQPRLRVGDLLELGGMKALVMQKRAEAKDYIDLHALLTLARRPLPVLPAAAVFLYGRTYAPEATPKAMAFYDDGNLATVPLGIRRDLQRAVRACDPGRLPSWLAPLPINERTLSLARRLVWFEPLEQALADPIHFLAYAFRDARSADLALIREHPGDDDLREALRRAPPGIIDARSWAYWHLMLDLPLRAL